MITTMGAMLGSFLHDVPAPAVVAESAEFRLVAEPAPELPVVLQVEQLQPAEGEPWEHFKDRVGARLGREVELLEKRVGVGQTQSLYAGNALATDLTAEQLSVVADDPTITVAFAELDPLLPVVSMDKVIDDIGLAAFRTAAGDLTGAGVRVAVLDSGIDRMHPALTVVSSVETCGEPVEIPGQHGTHCAGIIASSDPVAPGIAPGVDLIDVKVLRANGTGRHTAIAAGVDRALDLSANILSISLGFNHLPMSVPGGHGWTCPDGACPLCRAVDNAVLEGVLAVAAAGNEHQRCEAIRAGGQGLSYDTELCCPGQARAALTVGSVTRVAHTPAGSSSNGPTAYNLAKPDLSAPGVDILSTIPVPRDAGGAPVTGSPASLLFGVKSGTSMATPVVAGACALLIEAARRHGGQADPASIRQRLLTCCVERVGGPVNVVGAGRLRLA